MMEQRQKWLEEYRTATHLDRKQKAAENLVMDIYQRLHRFLLLRCPYDDVDDVLQESLKDIFKGLDGFKSNSSAFAAWSFQITRRKLANHLESARLSKVEPMDIHQLKELIEGSVQTTPLTSEETERLEDALQIMREAKPPCRDLLEQRFVSGYSYQEIGQKIGKTSAATREQIVRCVKLIQKLIARKGSAYA